MNNLKDLSRTLDVTNFCLYVEEKCLLLLISFISVLFSDEDKSLQKEYTVLETNFFSQLSWD